MLLAAAAGWAASPSASAGIGSPNHLAAALFVNRTGLDIPHVSYKGGGPAAVAVMSGEVKIFFASLATVLPHMKAGTLKGLAVTGPTRAPEAPAVPTMQESGFPGFDSSNFKGLMAPAGTPRHIIRKLHDELVRIVHSPENVARMTALGSIPVGNTPEQFAEEIRLETAKWARIVKEHNIKAD